jgi:hypothetical protein
VELREDAQCGIVRRKKIIGIGTFPSPDPPAIEGKFAVLLSGRGNVLAPSNFRVIL